MPGEVPAAEGCQLCPPSAASSARDRAPNSASGGAASDATWPQLPDQGSAARVRVPRAGVPPDDVPTDLPGPRCPPTRRPTEGQAWPPSLTLHLILTPPRAHRGHSAGRSGLMSPHGPLACGSDWMSAPAAHSLPPGRRPGARDSHRLLPPGPGPAKVRRRVGGGGMTPRGSPSRVSSGLLAVGHFTQE